MAAWPNSEERNAIFNNVFTDASLSRYYLIMVVLSCTVATYGLLSNSTAVVIGAMLIAPLMGPILGCALAVAANSRALLVLALKAEALGAVAAVLLAMVLTLLLPRAELTSEVMARTTPTILDLVIALASGAAGTYAICMKPQSATLPGVAIATALMPPLCTVGIGLAQQNMSVAGGAFLLFLANMVAIVVAAVLVFELAGFADGHGREKEAGAQSAARRLFYPVLLLVIISVPLAFIMYKTYAKAHTEQIIQTSLEESLDMIAPQSTLISATFNEADRRYEVAAAFRTTKVINPENIRQMENLLELRLGKAVKVSADVVLVQKVNDEKNIDSFQMLLPKIKEKEIVEVVRSGTPEEIIEQAIKEKLSLLPDVELEDYRFSYQRGGSTYQIEAVIVSAKPIEESVRKSLQAVLEERLKRRVEVQLRIKAPPTAAAEVEKASQQAP